ncbi:MAG: TIR domain-containing protein, partial [Nitrospira sp.]|nr:TIR domain-containing protein [Nitrospira sp.]
MPDSPRNLTFISYSHDSTEHIDLTLELSGWLCQRGINCNLDQYEESPPEGWARWCRNQIIEAEAVLVICTEKYERRFSGREKAGAGRGVKWEGAIVSQELYESESNNNKFIPVVFSKDDLAFIPIELRGVTHYDVSTEGGRTQLYRRLTGQPLITKPDIGEVQILPARERKCSSETVARVGIFSPRHENRIREFAGNYWREGARLLVSLSIVFAVLNILEFPIESLIGLTMTRMTDYWVLGVAIAILTLVSFPRVAEAITLTIRGPKRLASLENTLFRGPRSYGPHDHLPGRKAELDACQLRFRDKSFFILDGESGCGKSSFLNAVLLPQCRHTFRVVECRIGDDPFGKLYDALQNKTHRKVDAPINEAHLASVLMGDKEHESHDTAATNVKPILVCMDQFEELFVTVRDETRRRFFNVLRQAINTGSVRVLIAIRSDFRDLLDKACRDVDPEQAVLDAGNYYSLSAFRKEQAEDVLIELLAPLYSSNTLFNKQLDDFSVALVNDLLRSPRDRRLSHLDQKTVLPVELQTVGMMIEQIGINYFSAVGFREVGGKLGLLRRYIDDAKAYVWHRTGVPGDQALLILRQLISPARTKWTQTAQSIGNACRIPAYKVEKVLEAFSARYLVNPVLDNEAADSGIDARTSLQYELMHEHLIQIITDAPNPVLQKARDAEERLSFWRQRAGLHLSDNVKSRFFNPRTQILFRMPIPLGESLRLLRFASIPADRLMLRHNLRGFTLRTLAAAVLILGPWLVWLYSPWGQIQLIRWDIASLKNGNDQDTLQVMARGFASAGFLEQSLEVAARLDDPMEKANALRDMVQATAQMGDANKVAALLKQVLEVAARLDDPYEKAYALRDMAEAMADLASERKNTGLLNLALEAAARIDEASAKVRALCAVAQATAQMGDAS